MAPRLFCGNNWNSANPIRFIADRNKNDDNRNKLANNRNKIAVNRNSNADNRNSEKLNVLFIQKNFS